MSSPEDTSGSLVPAILIDPAPLDATDPAAADPPSLHHAEIATYRTEEGGRLTR